VYRNIKTRSSILTGCRETSMSRVESWAARKLVRFQTVTANLDPEVLQWPGGSLIASLLWCCMMARSLQILRPRMSSASKCKSCPTTRNHSMKSASMDPPSS
jgi:hypothetical protein